MNLRSADSEASPVVARCQDGVGIISLGGMAPGFADGNKVEGQNGEAAGGHHPGPGKRELGLHAGH